MTRVAALVLAAGLLAGCAAAPRGIAIATSTWQATISIDPWPPAGVAAHRIVIAFTGARPAPPVVLQMGMPEMSHGIVDVPLRATAAGRYEGRAAFEMAGTWQLTLTAGNPPQQGSASVTVTP